MKKILAMALCMGILAMSFTACGGAQEPLQIDLTALSDKLQKELTFKDTLAPIDEEMMSNYYPDIDLAKVEQHIVLISGTSSTAEEIALFKVKNSADTGMIDEAMKQRILDQTISFEDYNPQEMVKINNAVIKTSGNYVMMVLCDDTDTASAILDEQIK